MASKVCNDHDAVCVRLDAAEKSAKVLHDDLNHVKLLICILTAAVLGVQVGIF